MAKYLEVIQTFAYFALTMVKDYNKPLAFDHKTKRTANIQKIW